LSVLSAVYGRVARLRRSWYQQRPHARRRLDRPVISVGNLVVGGSGKTPAVALTAYARAEDRRNALLAGFQTHVPKPVDPAELLAVVASLVGRPSRPGL